MLTTPIRPNIVSCDSKNKQPPPNKHKSKTHQHLLQLLYSLVGNTDAVDFPDLISNMQCSWTQEKGKEKQAERQT